MTDAPKKIWLRWEPGKAITQGPLTEHPDYTEYTRTDQHLALVAAAYEAGADVARKPYLPFSLGGDYIMDTAQGEVTADAILSLTPEDALAILDRVKREARNEARREALEAINASEYRHEAYETILVHMEDTDDGG